MAGRKRLWIKKAISRPGALTAKAKKAGFKTATAFARHVRANKSRYSARTIRQANLALTLRGFRRAKKRRKAA